MSSAINVEKLEKISLQFMGYNEKINSIFNELDLEISNIKSNLSGDYLGDILSRYKIIKENKKTIQNNIKSYIEDFIKLKKNYQNQDEVCAELLRNSIEKVEERR